MEIGADELRSVTVLVIICEQCEFRAGEWLSDSVNIACPSLLPMGNIAIREATISLYPMNKGCMYVK